MHLDSEDRWLAVDFGALCLISSPSTAAHFRRPGGRTGALQLQRGNTKWHLQSGGMRIHPYHLAVVFATLAFKIMSLGRKAHRWERHFTVHSCRASAAAVSSKYAYFAQVLEEEMDCCFFFHTAKPFTVKMTLWSKLKCKKRSNVCVPYHSWQQTSIYKHQKKINLKVFKGNWFEEARIKKITEIQLIRLQEKLILLRTELAMPWHLE